MAQYDRTMKRLTSVFTRDYVRFALGADGDSPRCARAVSSEFGPWPNS